MDDLPHYCTHPHNAGMFLTGVIITLFFNAIFLHGGGCEKASAASANIMAALLVLGTLYALFVGF